ncbi:MAG: anaerobic ribonucleoside-triphosphate reductase activating protein [Hydrogenophilales bacterium CG_4_10_14_3_um_filter_63_21]|nr:MAG: anaerobic ribonucleoside-triphosphate reductase activating protein [Hydrogenophilales bacterium CG_4_10_14_3_um_filter_63_21]
MRPERLNPSPRPGRRGGERLRIGGFTPFTTTDYPGRLAAVVFCQGCPWRCAYCHNPHLLPADGPESHAWPDILRFLEGRRGLLDAVVFSGGEPTLQGGLADTMREAKAMGFLIGLHSAGMYPQRLARVLPLVDWIGLDVKAPSDAYPRITGTPGSGEAVFESLRLIVEAGVDHELRCTWHPAWLSAADLLALSDEIRNAGADRLVIQEHRPAGREAFHAEIVATDRERAGLDLLSTRFRHFALRMAHQESPA